MSGTALRTNPASAVMGVRLDARRITLKLAAEVGAALKRRLPELSIVFGTSPSHPLFTETTMVRISDLLAAAEELKCPTHAIPTADDRHDLELASALDTARRR